VSVAGVCVLKTTVVVVGAVWIFTVLDEVLDAAGTHTGTDNHVVLKVQV